MTPFATPDRHFLGNGGIRLHLAMAGNYPRIPGITLGLGLVLSFIARHTPVSPPGTVGLVGTSAVEDHERSDEQHVPVPMVHARQRRVLLRRPAGLLITVDDPMGRSHHPRAFAPS